VAGLLAESRFGPDGVEAVVVGIGLNVNWPAALPDDLTDVAVALNHVLGHPVDRVELLTALLVALDAHLELLAHSVGRDELRSLARAASSTLGRRVVVDLDGELVRGRATELLDTGELVVDVEDDGPRVIRVGDVHHLRIDGEGTDA